MVSMKSLVAVVSFAIVVILAAACGGGGEPGAPEAPATGRIAFASDRDGNFEVYEMNADGAGVTRLTDTPASDINPAWSPAQ